MLSSHSALLIATDIDGTLLDGEARLPYGAPEWRRAIHTLGASVASCEVAFASSRTLDELMVLQRVLGMRGPCIAEDGAILALDETTTLPADAAIPRHDGERRYGRRRLRVWTQARSASVLRELMADVESVDRADASRFTRSALHELGFHTPGAIRRALQARHHSLLLDPTRLTGDEIASARTLAAARGLQLRRGGRWLTLADGSGKGTALTLLRHLRIVCGVSPIVIAVGNEENDVSLLQKADLAFVIRNPGRGPHPVLAAIPHAVVLDTEGARGWLEMLSRLRELVT
jgi:mannosyl-3-phosphoglycerate phosphatase